MTIEQRKPRSRIFYVLLWISMLIISLLLIITVLNLFFGFSTQRLISLDWGGYAAASDYFNPNPVITGVSANWTVPKVTVTADDRYSAAWIGIGGQVDTTLIQVGTEHDSINGAETYSAWYELLPDESITIATIQVQPGDKINASIMLTASAANTWSIKIEDTTTGQEFSNSFTYNSSRLTAEWIVERPTVNNGLASLANFGTVTFTNATATNNNTTEPISGFSYARITMYNRQNTQLVSVSPLSTDGESFAVDYSDGSPTMSSFNNYTENTIAIAIWSGREKALRAI